MTKRRYRKLVLIEYQAAMGSLWEMKPGNCDDEIVRFPKNIE